MSTLAREQPRSEYAARLKQKIQCGRADRLREVGPNAELSATTSHGAVRWLQKREAGEERNKNPRECVRFHAWILSCCSQHRNDKKSFETHEHAGEFLQASQP